MNAWLKGLIITLTVLVLLVTAVYDWFQHRFPFGWSHACDTCLHFSLLTYAEEHDGWFPRGEATPEASLSLLADGEPAMASLLCGKTKSKKVAEEILRQGQLLSPETCDWHYVEGLRKDDDRRLALFWDKIGLGHNGDRLSDEGHYVGLISGRTWISAAEWPKFIAEQRELHAALKRPLRPGLLDEDPDARVIPAPGRTAMEWAAAAVTFVGVIAIWIIVMQMQNRLARTEQKLNVLLRHFGLDPAEGTPLSERVKEIARDPARKIEAIKVYREETGAGLADAKTAVEAFISGQ